MTQKRFFYIVFFLLIYSAIPILLNGQNKLWTAITDTFLKEESLSKLQTYELFKLERSVVFKTIQQGKQITATQAITLELPIPNKGLRTFKLTPSSILPQKLQQKYPDFQSFKIEDQNDPLLQGRLTWTNKGLYVHLNNDGETIFIEALNGHAEDETYMVYKGRNHDIEKKKQLICANHLIKKAPIYKVSGRENKPINNNLKVFRLAISSTEEFTNATGGTVEATLSSIINTLTSLNAIYERDVAIRFLLHEENERLIFTDDNPAPFIDNQSAFGVWSEHTAILDSLIGSDTYDIGHVFTTDCTGGVAGLAQLAGICSDDKANGVSCMFDEDMVEFRKTLYHEVGHQLGANHTWSNCGESANNSQRHAPTAIEPGSGSTIMSYGGICGSFNIVSSAQDNLHGLSILEIKETLARDLITCYQEIPLENTSPDILLREGGFVIPILTPFELEADVMDAENENLTYSWEQIDTGSVSEVGFPEGNAPSFRAFAPARIPVRTFPRTTNIILNRTSNTEVLPDATRNLNFGLTVRDNNEGGGSTAFAKISFSASATAGPFVVTQPDTANIEYERGDSIAILWEVANTDQAPVNCQAVNVYLSLDNGQTFPILLAGNIPNNGATKVALPDTISIRARIKVKGANNIFFDMSNNRFQIVEKLSTAVKDIETQKLNIYPNPAKNSITLVFAEVLNDVLDLTIIDALGRNIIQQKIIVKEDIVNLQTQQLDTGLYFIQGKIGAKSFVKKLIIQK